jgi:hypothetical protein
MVGISGGSGDVSVEGCFSFFAGPKVEFIVFFR